jgi:hypothetical protein
MLKNVPLTRAGGLFWICLLFLCVHGGLFLFDLSDPTAFLRGDRAVSRLDKIMAVLKAADLHSFQDATLNSGMPGDFLPHALLYRIGGPYFLIAFQIALQLSTLIITYLLAARITGSKTVALAAGLFFIVLPGSLMDPHLLTTEIWYKVLLMFGIALICYSMDSEGRIFSTSSFCAGFIFLALASAVRPQGLLVPLVVAGCLAATSKQNGPKIVAGTLLSFAVFPVSWMALRFLLVGEFGFGEYGSDLPDNLGFRADRILGVPFGTTGKLSLLGLADIARSHPVAAINTIYSDLINLFLNPGVNHVFGYYLKMFDSVSFYWVDLRDKSGLVGVVVEILRQNAVFLVLLIVWMIIHLTVLSGALAVPLLSVWSGVRLQPPVWIMIAVVATLMACSFASGWVRWDYRAGTEPILALLAAYFWFGWRQSSLGKLPVGQHPVAMRPN